ncbi:hypothetical protein GCM10025857_04620 [Alicyclobacillus contaminans]|nr:hypothetical protein GCM10025857_04620 [Alicyclobacillus contaminans]
MKAQLRGRKGLCYNTTASEAVYDGIDAAQKGGAEQWQDAVRFAASNRKPVTS